MNHLYFQTGAYHRKVPGFKPEMFKVGITMLMLMMMMIVMNMMIMMLMLIVLKYIKTTIKEVTLHKYHGLQVFFQLIWSFSSFWRWFGKILFIQWKDYSFNGKIIGWIRSLVIYIGSSSNARVMQRARYQYS